LKSTAATLTAIQRAVRVLREAGAEGIRRSDLGQRAELPAQVLDDVLRFLTSRGELRQEQEETARDRGGTLLRGRPATRYFYEPTDEFLPNELPAEFCTPKVRDPSTAPVPHGMDSPAVCVWCRTALPVQLTGRPRQFCSPECRSASALAAGRQLLAALQRPKDPYVFNAVARLAVAMDLRSRGFLVYGCESLGPLIVDRGGVPLLRVGVYVADEVGLYFEGEDSTEARAVVRRDGAIRYVGITFDADEPAEDADGDTGPQKNGAPGR
jgi:hypothetical protein